MKKKNNLYCLTPDTNIWSVNEILDEKNSMSSICKEKVLKMIDVLNELDDKRKSRIILKGLEALETYEKHLDLFKDYLIEDTYFINYKTPYEVFFTLKDLDAISLLDKMVTNNITAYVIRVGSYYIKTRQISITTPHIEYVISLYLSLFERYMLDYFELKIAHICYPMRNISMKVYQFLIEYSNSLFMKSLLEKGFDINLDVKKVKEHYVNIQEMLDLFGPETLSLFYYDFSLMFKKGDSYFE